MPCPCAACCLLSEAEKKARLTRLDEERTFVPNLIDCPLVRRRFPKVGMAPAGLPVVASGHLVALYGRLNGQEWLVDTSLIAAALTYEAATNLPQSRLADQDFRTPLGMGAGVTLHLAFASQKGATLYTLERQLAEAGPVLGIVPQWLG